MKQDNGEESSFRWLITESNSSAGWDVYRFGGSISKLGGFYSGVALPVSFSDGDTWRRTWFVPNEASYTCQSLGLLEHRGIVYGACYRLDVETPRISDAEFWNGTGSYIIAPDIGILKMDFTRYDGTEIKMHLIGEVID